MLVVHSRNDILAKSSRNLEFVKPLLVNLLNPHDLTKFDQILFEKSALEEAGKIFKIEKNTEKKVLKINETSKAKKKEPAKKIVSNKETAGVV